MATSSAPPPADEAGAGGPSTSVWATTPDAELALQVMLALGRLHIAADGFLKGRGPEIEARYFTGAIEEAARRLYLRSEASCT